MKRQQLQREISHMNNLNDIVEFLKKQKQLEIAKEIIKLEPKKYEEIFKIVDKHFNYDLAKDFNINEIKEVLK